MKWVHGCLGAKLSPGLNHDSMLRLGTVHQFSFLGIVQEVMNVVEGQAGSSANLLYFVCDMHILGLKLPLSDFPSQFANGYL